MFLISIICIMTLLSLFLGSGYGEHTRHTSLIPVVREWARPIVGVATSLMTSSKGAGIGLYTTASLWN